MQSLDALASQVFRILGEAGIPAEIIGGYALSHYGYVRNTMDVDVVVGGDYAAALQVLKDQGFAEAERVFKLMMEGTPDKRVDVLPAGKRMSGSPVANPTPTKASTSPEFIPLEDLIAMKIGVLLSGRAEWIVEKKNEVDVLTLVHNNQLSREFMDTYPQEMVRLQYGIMWDELAQKHAEGKRSSLDETYDPFADFFE